MSFLNIGSGTGYLSCIVAEILGPKSLNFGVEIHQDVVSHSKASIEKWLNARGESSDFSGQGKSNACIMEDDNIQLSNSDFGEENGRGYHKRRSPFPHLEIVHGNALHISSSKGESVVGFDRIYIGAALDSVDLHKLTALLSPGGILVGPVEDELIKVTRVGPMPPITSISGHEVVGDCNSGRKRGHDDFIGSSSSDDESSSHSHRFTNRNDNDSTDFSYQVLSGVRFAPLVAEPIIKTVLPARLWSPSSQKFYPDSFQKASMALLLCSNSDYAQPLIPIKKPNQRTNMAAMLPRVIWLEVLSYTNRKWFEPEQTETEYLKKRVAEEQAKSMKARQAQIDAESKCTLAERERDLYRLLARKWQSRIHVLLEQQQQHQVSSLSGVAVASSTSQGEVGMRSARQNNSQAAIPINQTINREENAAFFSHGLDVMLHNDMEDDESKEEDNGDDLDIFLPAHGAGSLMEDAEDTNYNHDEDGNNVGEDESSSSASMTHRDHDDDEGVEYLEQQHRESAASSHLLSCDEDATDSVFMGDLEHVGNTESGLNVDSLSSKPSRILFGLPQRRTVSLGHNDI
mmetsp:Transcript_27675/g.40864  ORF Transcript_27675/g.40864 Transcript_27675/m.40864 type:complete len:573 (+) Transcript_27675:772-2490(+)